MGYVTCCHIVGWHLQAHLNRTLQKYPLVIIHSHGKWPIEIDGLPIKNGDFPWLCYINNQMVSVRLPAAVAPLPCQGASSFFPMWWKSLAQRSAQTLMVKLRPWSSSICWTKILLVKSLSKRLTWLRTGLAACAQRLAGEILRWSINWGRCLIGSCNKSSIICGSKLKVTKHQEDQGFFVWGLHVD